MDQETRYAFASLYELVDELVSVASEARASALALEQTLLTASPERKATLEKCNHSAQVTEIRLQAEHTHVSLRQAIARLRTLNT